MLRRSGLGLVQYNVSAFSAFFHLLAMRAASALARSPAVADASFADACDAAEARGREAVEALLWNASGGFYRSYTGGDAIHADALYAQAAMPRLRHAMLYRTVPRRAAAGPRHPLALGHAWDTALCYGALSTLLLSCARC